MGQLRPVPTPEPPARQQPSERPKRIRTEAQNAAFFRAGGRCLLMGIWAERVSFYSTLRQYLVYRLSRIKDSQAVLRSEILDGRESAGSWQDLIYHAGGCRMLQKSIRDHKGFMTERRQLYLHRLP